MCHDLPFLVGFYTHSTAELCHALTILYGPTVVADPALQKRIQNVWLSVVSHIRQPCVFVRVHYMCVCACVHVYCHVYTRRVQLYMACSSRYLSWEWIYAVCADCDSPASASTVGDRGFDFEVDSFVTVSAASEKDDEQDDRQLRGCIRTRV